MTGYGLGTSEADGLKVTVELRSVNNRFADLKLRLPDELAPYEPDLRRKILGTVKRGRVDLDLRLDRTSRASSPIVLNRAVVDGAREAWRTLREEYGVAGEWDLATLMRVPGVFESSGRGTELADTERAVVDRALDAALAALDAERRREGGTLQSDLLARVARMVEHVTSIRERAGTIPDAMHRRILERVRQLADQVTLDPSRLAQEAAFLADRADVTEELVRLGGHLEQAASLLRDDGSEPVGKRLDFLLQEIQRETNTIASKCADLEISRKALDLKAETEKIREQIQNLE